MQRLVFTMMVAACLALSALGQKGEGSKKSSSPVVDQTQQQIDKRLADAKRRSGKSVELGRPVADPKRRSQVKCYTLDPYSWNLAFPHIPSEYGGTVCVLRH